MFANRRTRNDLANAINEFESAVRIDPAYPDAWVVLADAYSAMANYNFMQPREGLDKARQAAARAVQLSPDSGRANGAIAYVIAIDARRRLQARAYFERGARRRPRQPAARAVQLSPDSGRANGAIAYVIAIDVRRWLQARSYFERAVRRSPREPLIRLWYGAWLGKVGQSSAAEAQLNAGLEQDPASFNLHHQRAVEYFRAKRFQESLAEARALVRLQPYEASSHLSLARALEWAGELAEARKSWDEAAKYGNPPAATCGRGCVEAAAGNLSEAERLASQVYQYWKNNPFETLSVAQLFSRLRGPQDIVAILDEGYRRDDSTVLGAPASPYFEKWRQEPSIRGFFRRLGLPARFQCFWVVKLLADYTHGPCEYFGSRIEFGRFERRHGIVICPSRHGDNVRPWVKQVQRPIGVRNHAGDLNLDRIGSANHMQRSFRLRLGPVNSPPRVCDIEVEVKPGAPPKSLQSGH